MMFWLIAVPSATALFALVWWTSGRAKPDLRRRSISTDVAIREGSDNGFGFPGGDVGGGSGGTGGL